MQNQHTRELISEKKKITQAQQQRPESPTVTLTWHASKYKVHKLHQRRLDRSLLLCLCDIFQALINSPVWCDAWQRRGIWWQLCGMVHATGMQRICIFCVPSFNCHRIHTAGIEGHLDMCVLRLNPKLFCDWLLLSLSCWKLEAKQVIN